MRFLIVDDSSTMRRIIINTLTKLGYELEVDTLQWAMELVSRRVGRRLVQRTTRG